MSVTVPTYDDAARKLSGRSSPSGVLRSRASDYSVGSSSEFGSQLSCENYPKCVLTPVGTSKKFSLWITIYNGIRVEIGRMYKGLDALDRKSTGVTNPDLKKFFTWLTYFQILLNNIDDLLDMELRKLIIKAVETAEDLFQTQTQLMLSLKLATKMVNLVGPTRNPRDVLNMLTEKLIHWGESMLSAMTQNETLFWNSILKANLLMPYTIAVKSFWKEISKDRHEPILAVCLQWMDKPTRATWYKSNMPLAKRLTTITVVKNRHAQMIDDICNDRIARASDLDPAEKKRGTILVLGLEGAGKTAITNHLASGSAGFPTPTVGHSKKTATIWGTKWNILDVGGSLIGRETWRLYTNKADGIIFVVDSTDKSRIQESMEALSRVYLGDADAGVPPPGDIPLLVLANKQDYQSACKVSKIENRAELRDLTTKKIVLPACAKTGQNISPGLMWLTEQIERTH
mmetsp:Transcript_13439/g.35752  ORF Transcript_13439/g.35752 Transcript_13439/m.35752 type:complete len:458 (-) Transcript_13439:101-1474(-)